MTLQDLLERLWALVEGGAPLDAKLFFYQSQVAATGDYGLPTPEIVLRAEWSTGPNADFHAEDLVAVRMDIQLGDPQQINA